MINYAEEIRNAERKLDEAIKAYNDALVADDKEAIAKADEDCAKAKEDYNTNAKMQFYARCFAADEPLLEACKLLHYQTIKYVDKESKDTKRVKREKAYVDDTQIKLGAFKRYAEENVGKRVGAEPDWHFKIAKFTQLLTFYACTELGYTKEQIKQVSNSYAINKLADEIDMGKTPTSKTQIQKQLQDVVTAMIGEGTEDVKYKVTSHDAAFIRMKFAKKSRAALVVAASSPAEMEFLLSQICHRIILNKNYSVEYKHFKG